MVPPNNVITLLKEAQRVAATSLRGTGFEPHSRPVTREQMCCISLMHALEVARLYTQMCEDGLYEELLNYEKTERPPHPW